MVKKLKAIFNGGVTFCDVLRSFILQQQSLGRLIIIINYCKPLASAFKQYN